MSGKITPNYIAIRKGDSFTIRFQFKCGNEFVDINGSSLKMQVKNQSDKKTVLTKLGFIDDALKGKAHIGLLPEDTQRLNCDNNYLVDIKITFANGEVHTFYPQDVNKSASFIISENITE